MEDLERAHSQSGRFFTFEIGEIHPGLSAGGLLFIQRDVENSSEATRSNFHLGISAVCRIQPSVVERNPSGSFTTLNFRIHHGRIGEDSFSASDAIYRVYHRTVFSFTRSAKNPPGTLRSSFTARLNFHVFHFSTGGELNFATFYSFVIISLQSPLTWLPVCFTVTPINQRKCNEIEKRSEGNSLATQAGPS